MHNANKQLNNKSPSEEGLLFVYSDDSLLFLLQGEVDLHTAHIRSRLVIVIHAIIHEQRISERLGIIVDDINIKQGLARGLILDVSHF